MIVRTDVSDVPIGIKITYASVISARGRNLSQRHQIPAEYANRVFIRMLSRVLDNRQEKADMRRAYPRVIADAI